MVSKEIERSRERQLRMEARQWKGPAKAVDGSRKRLLKSQKRQWKGEGQADQACPFRPVHVI